jgi:hypothetical protein
MATAAHRKAKRMVEAAVRKALEKSSDDIEDLDDEWVKEVQESCASWLASCERPLQRIGESCESCA